MLECRNLNENLNFVDNLSKYNGETVTIFTKSGGQSGCGFTGVILDVNACFCRLITCIGPSPNCALGNACCRVPCHCRSGRRWDGRNVGAVIDIPIDSIASFVHNAV